MNGKFKKVILLLAIIIFAYEIILFTLCGFSGHTAAFWLSWSMMTVAYVTIILLNFLLKDKKSLLRDWLFHFPLIRHATIYLMAEFILSTIFILFEKKVSWQWAFAPQLIVLAVFWFFFISCLLPKEIIQDVKTNVSDKTRFVQLLRVEVEMLLEKCADPALKEKVSKLAEAIRFSDPMSSEALFELEKEIALTVSSCDQAMSENRWDDAEKLCDRASLLLTERNKKCIVLK